MSQKQFAPNKADLNTRLKELIFKYPQAFEQNYLNLKLMYNIYDDDDESKKTMPLRDIVKLHFELFSKNMNLD